VSKYIVLYTKEDSYCLIIEVRLVKKYSKLRSLLNLFYLFEVKLVRKKKSDDVYV